MLVPIFNPHRALIESGPRAGRLTDVEVDDDDKFVASSDLKFEDACCNQDGADCSRYIRKRPIIPNGPPDAVLCKLY
jgi:hypothetical protein